MISPRILNRRALIERDANPGPGSTGPGSHVPSWETVATDVPCSVQSMNEKLKRGLPGDFAVTDSLFGCNPGPAIAKGQRVTVDGVRYRIEALRDAAGRGHHWEAGLKAL